MRSTLPASDLRFAPIFRLNVGASLGLHSSFKTAAWARHLKLKIDVNNVTDARSRVRDANGAVPNRLQADRLDPVGRVMSVTLRKLS